jgi:uncharacterized coiled-coil protein SlyX
MRIKPFHLLLSALLVLLLTNASRADDASADASIESRLRDALRTTMLQLRDAQTQVVTLQAAQAQSDKDKADLQAKVDALSGQVKTLTDQAASDKAASDKAIADLNAQVTDQTGQIAKLNDALKEWKDAYNQVAQLAAAKEAARADLAGQVIVLQRVVDDRELKNFALYKLGMEILTRYEQFSLGDALTAKEPFVGISRVKLETLVQDYKDKLIDQAITSGQPLPAAPNSSAPASASGKPVKPKTAAPVKPVNSA